jgi:exosortase/archaeosortase family protein
MATKNITIRYIIIYTAVFVATIYLFNNIPSQGVEAFTAQTSIWFLNLFGQTATWAQTDGYTTLTLPGQQTVTVSIIRECTALNILGILTGLILPLREGWTRRFIGVTLSALLLFALNTPRIALTVYLTAYPTWPFTMLAESTLETYHYPISFAFGVIGVALTILAVNRLATPTLSETLLAIYDKATTPAGNGTPSS